MACDHFLSAQISDSSKCTFCNGVSSNVGQYFTFNGRLFLF